jgi:hypothetical protein
VLGSPLSDEGPSTRGSRLESLFLLSRVDKGGPTRAPTRGPGLLLVDNGGPTRAPTRGPGLLLVDNGGPTRAPTRGPVLLLVDNGGPTWAPTRGPVLLLVDNGGPTRAPTRVPVLLLVDNGGPTRAPTRGPGLLLVDNGGPTRAPTWAPVLLHYDTQTVPVLIISRHRLRRGPRDHHSTLPNPSCMRKQDLLIIVADILFDNYIVCILLQKILSAFTPQSRTNTSAYRIPLPRQIIRIQRIRAQIFPVDFDIRRTIHLQTRNSNFCLRVSASASRNECSRVNFSIIVECSSPLRAPAAAPASAPGLALMDDFYIAAPRACARTGGAVYAYCAFRYGEHAIAGIVVRAGPRHVS